MEHKGKTFYCFNKKAKYDYFIEEQYEAGIVLFGDEVKSIRKSQISIEEGYLSITPDEQLQLHGVHITQPQKGCQNFETVRIRSVLMKKSEIRKLARKITEKGYTLIPYNVYAKRSLIKLTVALAKGKQKRDKREEIKKRDHEREIKLDSGK